MFEGDLMLHRTPIFKFCILHATDYFVQYRSSTRARTLSSFSKKFIFKTIQDQYFDITLFNVEVFIFKTWSPTNPTEKSHHLVGCVAPVRSTDVGKLIVRVCIANNLINQKFK
jgi:hypothetical protein